MVLPTCWAPSCDQYASDAAARSRVASQRRGCAQARSLHTGAAERSSDARDAIQAHQDKPMFHRWPTCMPRHGRRCRQNRHHVTAAHNRAESAAPDTSVIADQRPASLLDRQPRDDRPPADRTPLAYGTDRKVVTPEKPSASSRLVQVSRDTSG